MYAAIPRARGILPRHNKTGWPNPGTSNSDTWCISETKVSEHSSILYWDEATVRSLRFQAGGQIIKTLVKLQCSAPCISSYNMKATMCQQCCKSGSSKIYKFIVRRLYVLLRRAHGYLQHVTANQNACYKLFEPIETIWKFYFHKQDIIVCSISFIRRHSNGTCRRHQMPKRRPNFTNWELVAMISMVSDNKILLLGKLDNVKKARRKAMGYWQWPHLCQ